MVRLIRLNVVVDKAVQMRVRCRERILRVGTEARYGGL
jgi:hypothetical protein